MTAEPLTTERARWVEVPGGYDYMRGPTRLASVKSWGGWRTERGDEGFDPDIERAKTLAKAAVVAFEIAPEQCGPPRRVKL